MPDSPTPGRLGTPSWLDVRLVLGVLLVLVSVVVGARVLSRADHTRPVWVAAHPLGIGSVLRAEDLERRQVRLLDAAAHYLPAGAGDPAPAGYVLTRPIAGGELLPREALRLPQSVPALREVSVPVDVGHLPADLAPGQVVDLYVTRKEAVGPAASPAASGGELPREAGGTRLVLASLAVVRVAADNRAAAGAVVVAVPAPDAVTLVAALRAGTVDLVRVPQNGRLPALDPSVEPAEAAVTPTGGR